MGLQAGVAYFRYTTGGGVGLGYLMPEASLVARFPLGRFSPYLGVGGGLAAELESRAETDLTLHVAAGSNVMLADRWETVTELRVRSMDPWTGNNVDILAGLGLRF